MRNIRINRVAFSLVELMIVVVILGIVGAMVVPMVGSASSMQIRSAANKIAADMEYAKSLAISTQQGHSLIFDASAETYYIQNSSTGITIKDPMKSDSDYIVDFTADSRLNKVNISTVDFDSTNAITFDYLGSPFKSTTITNPLVDGTDGVTVTCGNITYKILVEPVTGYISIQE